MYVRLWESETVAGVAARAIPLLRQIRRAGLNVRNLDEYLRAPTTTALQAELAIVRAAHRFREIGQDVWATYLEVRREELRRRRHRRAAKVRQQTRWHARVAKKRRQRQGRKRGLRKAVHA